MRGAINATTLQLKKYETLNNSYFKERRLIIWEMELSQKFIKELF